MKKRLRVGLLLAILVLFSSNTLSFSETTLLKESDFIELEIAGEVDIPFLF